MTGLDRRAIGLAFCLAGVAGYVDSLGFLTLKGFFVSFMSGNSTRLSVGLASGNGRTAEIAGGLIGLFVSGVMVGAVVHHMACAPRRRVLQCVAGLLAASGLAASMGYEGVSVAVAAVALGAENNVVAKAGGISIGVTYMTGTLVKLGQAIVGALTGGERWTWVPYLLLWAALVVGAVMGAALFPVVRMQGMWIAAAWCAGLVPLARTVSPAR